MSSAVVPASRSSLLHSPWFLFHLCDLDAPAVAVVWQILLARSFGAPLQTPAILALGLSVWLIYAADRLLDVLPQQNGLVTARHRFHGLHQRQLFAAVIAGIVALSVVCCLLQPAVLRGGIVIGFAILLYMGTVHLLPRASYKAVPKEINVGVLFALGTSLAPACRGAFRPSFLLAVLLFGMLCCLNCCAIEVWEWRPGSPGSKDPHIFTQRCVQWLRPMLWMVIAIAALLLFTLGPERFYAAVILSALGFLAVASLAGRVSTDLLRVLIDLPLLSPLLFLIFPVR